MTITLTEKHKQILDATGHVLVLGGPGSGKTTIALKKAAYSIENGLGAGQSVLFLSFSRAAIARIAEASRTEVEKPKRDQLSMHTFHSFCWEMLRSHAYLIGCPKRRLQILLPHEEKSLSGAAEPPAKGQSASTQWQEWLNLREQMFYEDGKIAFDLFAPKTAELLTRCSLILQLITNRHPLIVVDEAQDTSADAWRCIEIFSPAVQLICLGDLEQQIFDHLEGIGPERIAHIQERLNPLVVDLGAENRRSPDTEILSFANDILENVIRDEKYEGVSRQMYHPKRFNPTSQLGRALDFISVAVQKVKGSAAENIAILAPTAYGVATISHALRSAKKPIAHKLLFDDAIPLLNARIGAFLLEPQIADNERLAIATILQMLAAVRRASGRLSGVEKYLRWANEAVEGKIPRCNLVGSVLEVLHAVNPADMTGDPRQDLARIEYLLANSKDQDLHSIAVNLKYAVSFSRGKRIAAALAQMWMEDGGYLRGRQAFDLGVAEDQIVGGLDDLSGIHVMTIHKSKGKQFDGVIILREGRRDKKKKWESNLVWRDDPPPYKRSRKILRVGITRARFHVLIVEPLYPKCPILTPHKL